MNKLLEYPTGYGKSRRALEICRDNGYENILIIIPRKVLLENWNAEIKKWKFNAYVAFVTYASIDKIIFDYDCIIFDECHHISERVSEIIKELKPRNSILLSASVNGEVYDRIIETFDNVEIEKVSTRQAIEENRLPEPKVYLYAMNLEEDDRKVYNRMSNEIERLKRVYYARKDQYSKNIWLMESGKRLKWLSNHKTKEINDILSVLEPYRTITFCSSIKQTQELSGYYVNSKSRNSQFTLERFNKGRIDHITACDMLNEGVNLVDCQIGVYASLHSSERLIIQQLGRLLRHKEPVIIIPYYAGTRDEEIVMKMMEHYNAEKVEKIENKEQIKID